MKLPSIGFSLHYGSRLTPARDWLFVLGVCGVVFLGSAVWSLWLFQQVVGGGVFGERMTPNSSLPSSTSLQDIEAVFSLRASEAEKFKNGTYRFVDPSK